MYRYVSLERWAALRALRDGEAPTFPRLAAASDLNVTTIRDHASRHNWAKQPFQSRKQREAWAGRGRGVAALAAGEIMTPDLAELETLTRPEDQIARLGDYLVRALAKLIASRRFTAIYFWPETPMSKLMSLTLKDMDFIEAKNSDSRDIGLAFGVPPMLLGIPGTTPMPITRRPTAPSTG